ncbi:carbohydrate ABC transporter substrate-binding protein (CUT1 family) [Knoellia remsis]|uniref:Carbohydrate ABC transporter substrate-binding protein (CUT1 family) n=1 Tax=Knoellia remsis TaxID=407159 RepID=A0A2T0UJY9_9MICO|nr:ABC transporter substrate-binding protein [Knoellia remsis]PRY58261.1 carbohydrate ABC transporter substrate-binding protein (CUT1 family) [Knoellia remsis]
MSAGQRHTSHRSSTRSRSRIAATIGAAVVAGALLGACSQGPANDPDTVTVWNLDSQPDRIAAAEKIAARWTEQTGTKVEQVAVQENQVPSLLASAAVSGTLPDVIAGAPLALVRQLQGLELLDTAAPGRVVDALGTETFADNALELTRDGDTQLAVPSDAWVQVLVYRKDLVDAAGLEAPTTYDTIRRAAQELTTKNVFGITLATDPGDPFTQQTFEALALGNGCQLVGDDGQVTLDSQPCAAAYDLYGELATQRSPDGTQSVDSTRATYFAGQSAMLIWSTFVLDEMAGLRNDALPTCQQCQGDKTWLAKNSGIVSAFTGPDSSEPTGYGEIASWAVLTGSDRATGDYVQFMMSDGYADALAIAPEGKYPVRTGDESDPQKFTDLWPTLPAGVDEKKPLNEVYPAQTLQQIADATTRIQRWAIPQGQGQLLGPVVAELVVPKGLAALATGETPRATAASTQDAVVEIQRSLR